MRKYSRTSVVVPLAYACVNTRARPRVLLQLPLTLLALQTHCMQTYLILTDGWQRLGVMEEVGNRQRGYRMDEPPPVSRTHRREPSIAGGTQRHRHQPSEQKVPQTVWDATRYWDVCMTCLLELRCLTLFACRLYTFLRILYPGIFLITACPAPLCFLPQTSQFWESPSLRRPF